MSTRKLQSAVSPFLVAPSRSPHSEKTKKPGDLDWRAPGSRSPKTAGMHGRKTSELPVVVKTNQRRSGKGSRSPGGSPKSPFHDLNAMLQFLSGEDRKKRSPYHSSQHHFSPSPHDSVHSKSRSPPSTAAQKSSFAFQAKVAMKVEKGVVKSPKIYDNQIFRDVFDPTGNHDKELYTSFADASLEVYHETAAAGGRGVALAPKSSSKASLKQPLLHEKPTANREPDTTKVEEERDSPAKVNADFGEELWRKLNQLQEARGDSETDTACEEFRDSRKQGVVHHKS